MTYDSENPCPQWVPSNSCFIGAFLGQQRVVDSALELLVLCMERETVQTPVVVVDWISGVAHRNLGDLAPNLAHVRPGPVIVPEPMPTKQ